VQTRAFVSTFFQPSMRSAISLVAIARSSSSLTHNPQHFRYAQDRRWTKQAGEQAKVEQKTVQGILRPAKLQTTLDLYTQGDSAEHWGLRENILRLGVGSYLVQ
jgi:hypothetical protein